MILRIADRYIIKSFILSLLVCIVTLVSLFVVIDTFSNLSNIVTAWRQTAKGISQLPLLVLQMNAVRMPLIFYELAPVLTLSAAMFTIVRLRRSNEITPLLASGVSIYRVVWPVFFMAIVLTVLQIADREILIPEFGADIYEWDRVRNENFTKYRYQAILEDGYGNVIFAGTYHIQEKELEYAQMTSYWPAELGRLPKVKLNAIRARWVEQPAKGWVFSDGAVIQYDSAGNVVRQDAFRDNGVFVPLVSEGPRPRGFELFTDVTPPRLVTKEVDIFYRPTLYLLEYAHEHGFRADVALDINKRIAAPLTNFVLLLIGLPFALRRDMKSPFLGAALAVAVCGAYYALVLLCENFARQGQFLTPLTGAWAPIIIFGPIGVILFDAMES